MSSPPVSIGTYFFKLICFANFRFMDKRMMLKLNGGRSVSGILRGFDPFMNVVIDETVEECKDGTKNTIGMVVCVQKLRLFSTLPK